MARPEAQHEPAWPALFNGRPPSGHLISRVQPDVEYSCDDPDTLGGLEQVVDGAGYVATNIGDKQRRVAQLFELCRRFRDRTLVRVEPQLSAPDADLSQIKRHGSSIADPGRCPLSRAGAPM